MTIRKSALGGVAAVAFAALVSTGPVYAHTSQPATPEEMQQTDALNAQALANARGTPNAQLATAAMPAPAAMPGAIETPASDTAMPAAPLTQTAAATPLNALATAPTLNNAAVQDSDGAAVGMVKSVIIGSDGKPSIVDVALSDNSKVVALSANELSFDQTSNILVASLTNEQIKALPAANS